MRAMRTPPFLLPLVAPLAATLGLWACVVDAPADNGGGATTTSGSGGTGGTGGTGGSGASGTATTSTMISCTIDNGSDPVGLCTQKLVLKAEHAAAVDVKRGV